MLDGDKAVVDKPLDKPDAQDKALVDKSGNQEENNTQVEYVNKSLVEDAALPCRKWNKKSFDWQYYTHQTTPTVADHAQHVARQATAAQRTIAQSVVGKEKSIARLSL